MTIETSKIYIDDDLILDANTGIIGSDIFEEKVSEPVFPMEELMTQIDKLNDAISDLESSFDSHSISRLSHPNREGIYYRAGLLTNIVLGVVIALILLILII